MYAIIVEHRESGCDHVFCGLQSPGCCRARSRDLPEWRFGLVVSNKRVNEACVACYWHCASVCWCLLWRERNAAEKTGHGSKKEIRGMQMGLDHSFGQVPGSRHLGFNRPPCPRALVENAKCHRLTISKSNSLTDILKISTSRNHPPISTPTNPHLVLRTGLHSI